GGRADGGRRLDDERADRRGPGVLHLEARGAELRRLDAGAALAVLADPVLAADAHQGRGGRPVPWPGPPPRAAGPGALGALGRLRDAQPPEPPPDPRRARAPEPLPAAPVNADPKTA